MRSWVAEFTNRNEPNPTTHGQPHAFHITC